MTPGAMGMFEQATPPEPYRAAGSPGLKLALLISLGVATTAVLIVLLPAVASAISGSGGCGGG